MAEDRYLLCAATSPMTLWTQPPEASGSGNKVPQREQIPDMAASRAKPTRKWMMPFLWILLVPIVTVPVSALLIQIAKPSILHESLDGLEPLNSAAQEDLDFNPWAGAFGNWFVSEYDYVDKAPILMLFTVPGVLNLGAFLWLRARDRKVQVAAVVAGLLGFIRAVLPAIVLETTLDTFTFAGDQYYAFESEGFFSDFETNFLVSVWAVGFVAWWASLAAMGLFALIWHLGSTRPMPSARAESS